MTADSKGKVGKPHKNPSKVDNSERIDLATFMHSIRTQANSVMFAHQSLCNPKISTLLKAPHRGFICGCPNMSKKMILKYLNPSPPTAKGHMKQPRHGIQSTTKMPATLVPPQITPVPVTRYDIPPAKLGALHHVQEPIPAVRPLILPLFQAPPAYPGPAYGAIQGNHPPRLGLNVIDDDKNESITNVFCFGAFADKRDGVVYNDLTGLFQFMLLDGSVCFFVMFHYKTNAILVTPVAGLDDKNIFKAYKMQFDILTSKGYKPKINIMDNQATKHIKAFLTKQQCQLQLDKPHNHRLNAAKRAVQTFKDALIAALATTDSNFPLQLWDKITPQVQNTLNMMRASRINQTMPAYEQLNGPYDWNRYPLRRWGTKR
jgi:hypothetical protein